jgi:hypothetical protein
MPAVTRSKKHAAEDVDQLSGLMSSMNITPKSTRKHKTPRVKKEKDISDLFSSLAVSSKSRRRRKGVRFTHKKTHKTPGPADADAEDIDMSDILLGGKRRYRRSRRRTMRRR